MSLVGQNPLLPRRNIDGGYTSINGHYLATYLRCRRDCLAVMEWRRSRRRMGEGLPRPVHVSMRHREPCGQIALVELRGNGVVAGRTGRHEPSSTWHKSLTPRLHRKILTAT